ncbi:hypothetical protein H1R17_09930 [Flavobacterium sp. xlx-214]|nr:MULTISPECIES: hypothetical protein [unclassified Flavobacterium]MBA5793443.1 hypothetical protein [Flavobacterium sp. xlx-221]QMI82785.1 hypothetical protein H1R17_09930 [Flavobacterium sp. xlx-214]
MILKEVSLNNIIFIGINKMVKKTKGGSTIGDATIIIGAQKVEHCQIAI